jgi:hypothetical protein
LAQTKNFDSMKSNLSTPSNIHKQFQKLVAAHVGQPLPLSPPAPHPKKRCVFGDPGPGAGKAWLKFRAASLEKARTPELFQVSAA